MSRINLSNSYASGSSRHQSSVFSSERKCPITGSPANPDYCAWGVPTSNPDRSECCGLLHAVQCVHEGIDDAGDAIRHEIACR